MPVIKRTAKKREAEPVLDFTRATEWQRWLAKHHASSAGILLRITKGRVENALTYAEALDLALAWGWIDSQKRALDANAWLQRFTPRSAKSPWSKILEAARRVHQQFTQDQDRPAVAHDIECARDRARLGALRRCHYSSYSNYTFDSTRVV
jgi:hypothetical protein